MKQEFERRDEFKFKKILSILLYHVSNNGTKDFFPNFLPSQENEFSFAASREHIVPVVLDEKVIETRDLSDLTKFYLFSTINIPSRALKSVAVICCSQAGEEKFGLRLRSKSGQ